jgi:hypothetical protein
MARNRRVELAQINEELSQRNAEKDTLTISLRELGEPSDLTASGDVLSKVRDLLANLEATNRSLSQLDHELQSIENRRGRLASELEDLGKDQSLTPASDVTMETIAEVRERLSELRRSADEHDQKLRMLRDTQQALESTLSDTRSQIAATDGRLNAEEQRKRRTLESVQRQYSSLGLASVDGKTIESTLQHRAEQLGIEMVEIRQAIGQAKAIERRQLVNQSMIEQRGLQTRLEHVQDNLSMLRRAQSRFRLIAEGMRKRSKTEADSAGALYLAAAQECVNDMYPHRHLNEIDIDFAAGELLVKDRWLKSGVHPQDYSSTGQSNVLALSVFLGLALKQTFSSCRFLLLDEPVQNLDDLHFVAFIALLKRVASSHQVIISMADSNVAEIMRRHLRSWSMKNQKCCEYEWVAFQPETGPTITRHEWSAITYEQRLSRGPETSFEQTLPQ